MPSNYRTKHYTKFTACIDSWLEVSEVQAIKTPKHTPNANAFAEVWVGSLKRKCLRFFTCFSLGHVRHIVDQYVAFYNRHRAHQGVGNRLLSVPRVCMESQLTLILEEGSTGPSVDEELGSGRVKCHRILGGLLKHYYRAAA